MTTEKSLIDRVRADVENSFILHNVLVELNATGGSVIPRVVIFRPQESKIGWQLRVCSLKEPPALETLALSRESAVEELLEERDSSGGVACIVYSTRLDPAAPGTSQPGTAILEWLDLDANRVSLLVRSSDDGSTYTLNEIVGDLAISLLNQTSDQEEVPHTGIYSDAVLHRIANALSPLLRAIAPHTTDDDSAHKLLQQNEPLWKAIRKFSTAAHRIALELGEVRTDKALTYMSMTINYMRAQLYQEEERHQEALRASKLQQEKNGAKSLVKLQRELEMTKRRAETLKRQAQESRQELLALRAARGDTVVSPLTPVHAVEVPPATPLQRRMGAYLRQFSQLSATDC